MEVRANLLTTATDGGGSTTRVTLGTQFPSRAAGVNPAPPAGALRTIALSDETTLEITNARALDTEVADYWDGSPQDYTTRGLEYTPQYSEYGNAPATVYENSVLYNNFSTADKTRYVGVTEQQVVNGREIDLTALQGKISRSGSMSMSVTAGSSSGKTETIAVERQSSGNPVTVQFPSELPLAQWKELLRNERATNGGYITAISKSGGHIKLEFRQTDGAGNPITYELRTSAVSVGTGGPDPPPAYLLPISDTNADMTSSETSEFGVQVRNGFNGPESNVSLSASANSGTASVSDRTNVAGQATIDYTAPAGGSDIITVESDLDDSGTVEVDEQVQFRVTVETASGAGDSTSPAFDTGPTANPNPVTQSSDFELTATLNDTFRGGTDITKTTWRENRDGFSGSLTADDGQFDQPIEAVSTTISTSGWSSGDHTVTVSGEDANGNTRSRNIVVTVQTGEALPSDAVAFNDQNNDGVYDIGEPTYTESEAAELDESVDLVIERDIIIDKIDISTQSVQLKSGVKLDTSNELKLDVSRKIDIEGGILDSEKKMTLSSSNGGIEARGAMLTSTAEMKLTADNGDVDISSGVLTSDKKITLSSSNSGIEAQGAMLTSTAEMKLTADNGDVDISGGALTSDTKITLTSSSNIDARDTEFKSSGQIKASPASAGTLFVNDNGGTRIDGGTYIEDQNGNSSEISLQQGSVSGDPETSSVV